MRSLALVVLLAAACGGTQKPSQNLMEDLRAYHEGLRWQRFEDTAARLPASMREAFLDARDELEDELRVDDYEITRVRFGRSEKVAHVQVKVSWHLDSVGVVHETVVEQRWEEKKRAWFLFGEKVKRGEPMPGLVAAVRSRAAAK